MQNKIKDTILFAFAMVLLITGCKKNDSTNSTITPSASKLKTLTALPSGDVSTFYYDSIGRIKKVTTTATSNYLSYVYKGADSIIVFSSNGTDSLRVGAYKLNGIGLAITNSAPSNTVTYTYDVNGYETNATTNSILGSVADTFVISGNNITEHKTGASSPALFTTVNTQQVYTYLTSKTNTVSNANRGMSFLGKSSANPVNTETFHSRTVVTIPPGTTTADETYNYSYDYDSNNRITKMTKTAVSNSAVTSETYTYY
jgi:hypothetical protein